MSEHTKLTLVHDADRANDKDFCEQCGTAWPCAEQQIAALQAQLREAQERAEKAEMHAKNWMDKANQFLDIGNRDLIRAEAAEATVRQRDATIARLREALPDPDKLKWLKVWFDKKYPNDPYPEVQQDLDRWADNINAALATEPPSPLPSEADTRETVIVQDLLLVLDCLEDAESRHGVQVEHGRGDDFWYALNRLHNAVAVDLSKGVPIGAIQDPAVREAVRRVFTEPPAPLPSEAVPPTRQMVEIAEGFARDAIDLFLEYRDVHEYSEDRARSTAVLECGEGAPYDRFYDLAQPPDARGAGDAL